MGPGPRHARAWLFGVGLVAVSSIVFLARQDGELSVQSWRNLHFARRPSLSEAFLAYPMSRPPAYPMLLWLGSRLGAGPWAVNACLQALLVIGLAAIVRARHGEALSLAAALAYGLAHFGAVNMHQLTAEALFAPLLLLFALTASCYLAGAARAWLLALAATCALLCVTRLFALYFAVPAALLGVLWLAPLPARRRWAHAAVVAAASLAPIACWMYAAHARTGFWTGDDRTVERSFSGNNEDLGELTTPAANLRLTAETLIVDFFSPTRYAAHAVVARPYAPAPTEWAMLGVLGLAALTLGRAGIGALAKPPPLRSVLVAPVVIDAGLGLGFIAATIVIWSLGNNDPIYTRFLFPVYPLLLLAGFEAYAWLAARAERRRDLIPFRVLFAGFLAIQLARQLWVKPLPARFLG